jgi:hypothetical protein
MAPTLWRYIAVNTERGEESREDRAGESVAEKTEPRIQREER